jgi:hypothetical protein
VFKHNGDFISTDLRLQFQNNIIAKFHQQVVCWMDEWHGMNIDDIRAFEDKLAMEMAQKIADTKGN